MRLIPLILVGALVAIEKGRADQICPDCLDGGNGGGYKPPVPLWLFPLLQGQKVLDGRDGERGKQGWQGMQGNTGAVGDTGDEKGDKGSRGYMGDAGEKGYKGEMGIKGYIGSEGEKGYAGLDAITAGTVYIRWGREDCPWSHTLLGVAGRAAAPFHGETGGGTNYLCLPNTPVFPAIATGSFPQSDIVGVEFATAGEPLASVDSTALACANCFAGQSPKLMIPGTVNCPSSSWVMAYRGYLMSAKDQSSAGLTAAREVLSPETEHYRTEYICVDEVPTDTSATVTADDESLIYHVHFDCANGASLGCNPSSPPGQIVCVVCLYVGDVVA